MQILRAGNIQVGFENGALRTFKIDEIEVLRMIYFAVRDANWGTFEPQIKNLAITEASSSFSINYEVIFQENNDEFLCWEVSIKGISDNRIEFEIKGLALQDFQTNRTGFLCLASD
jgi:D-apionolactonase